MILLPIVFVVGQLTSLPADNGNKLWLVTSKSKLEISGTTNVNRFACSSTDYAGADTLREFGNKDGQRVLEGMISLNTSGFDCGNRLITRDFKKTLRHNIYPQLDIELSQLQEEPNSQEELEGIMRITIAGTSRSYAIKCTIKSASAREKHLEGQKYFKLSDFELAPPERLFGAIEVNDHVSVRFHLLLRTF